MHEKRESTQLGPLVLAVTCASVALAASRIEPPPARGGHAVTLPHGTHGISTAVISINGVSMIVRVHPRAVTG